MMSLKDTYDRWVHSRCPVAGAPSLEAVSATVVLPAV